MKGRKAFGKNPGGKNNPTKPQNEKKTKKLSGTRGSARGGVTVVGGGGGHPFKPVGGGGWGFHASPTKGSTIGKGGPDKVDRTKTQRKGQNKKRESPIRLDKQGSKKPQRGIQGIAGGGGGQETMPQKKEKKTTQAKSYDGGKQTETVKFVQPGKVGLGTQLATVEKKKKKGQPKAAHLHTPKRRTCRKGRRQRRKTERTRTE